MDNILINLDDGIRLSNDTLPQVFDSTDILQQSDTIVGPAGPAGPQGPAGRDGEAATISVGTTTTGAAGTNASVTNSGTSSAAVFNFTIPRGDTGATGQTGPQGPAGLGLVDFSTSEQPTGVKWIDNKIIYQKTITITSLPDTTYQDYPHGISFDYIVKYEGIYTDGSTYLQCNTCSTGSNNNNAFRTFITANNIRITVASNRTSWSGYITIWYTKNN